MTKGYGTIYREQKTQLSEDELKLLKEMFEKPSLQQRKTSRNWSKPLGWEIRRTVSAMSNLHGLDLIKGGKKSKYWTEDETKLIDTEMQEPEYWIGKDGEGIYTRVQYAIKNNGNILEFFKDETYCFSMALYPNDGRTKIVMNGRLVRYGNETLELEVDRISDVQARATMNEMSKQEITLKIIIETHDEEIKLKSTYDQNKGNGTVVK